MPAYFQGGKVLPVVAALTIAALRACDSTYAVDAASAAVLPAITGSVEGASSYHWESASTVADDGVNVIKPDGVGGGSPGRWIASNLNAPHVRGTQNALGATSTVTSVHARNITGATVGAPQWSPLLTLSGGAWDTFANAAKTDDWALQGQPQSASGAVSRLGFLWQTNGGGFTNLLAFDQVGRVWFASGVSALLSQDQAPGTGASAGFALILRGQQGQAQTGVAANNAGGDVQVVGGNPGLGGSGAAGLPGAVELFAGSSTSLCRYAVDASGNITAGFGFAAPFVAVLQATKTGSSVTPTAGNTLILQAQNGQQGSGGANNANGGQLQLKGGFPGSGGSGSAGVAGTVTVSNGATQVASFEVSNAGFGLVPYMNVANGGVRGTQVTVVSTAGSTFVEASAAVFVGSIAAPQAWGFNGTQLFVDTAVAAPSIFQSDNVSAGGTGTSLTVHAQNANGASGTLVGGNLFLAAGGASASGSIVTGGTLFLQGGTINGAVGGSVTPGTVVIQPAAITAGQFTFASGPTGSTPSSITVDGSGNNGLTIQLAQHTGTGTETAAALNIIGMPGRAVGSGSNNSGGNITIATGVVGTGAAGGTTGLFTIKDGGIAGTSVISAGAGGKLAFYGGTLTAQQARATNAPLTAATGSASNTIADVGAAFSQTTLNNNFKSLTTTLNALELIIHTLSLSA